MLSDRAQRRAGLLFMTLVLGACGGGNNTTSTGAGGSATTSAGTQSTGTDMSTSSTMSTTSGSSGTGGMGPSACTQNLLEVCKQLKMCAPHVYMAEYENDDMLCQSEAVRLCSMLPTAIDNTTPGVVDPAGCTTAVGASCNAFLA